jgi:hypothetical protein
LIFCRRKGLFHLALHPLDDVAPVAARALHRLGQRAWRQG